MCGTGYNGKFYDGTTVVTKNQRRWFCEITNEDYGIMSYMLNPTGTDGLL